MSYLTPAQLRLAIVSDVDAMVGTPASMEPPELQVAIDNAQAEVDARLAVRYKVPFADPVPGLVMTIVTGKAIYYATLQYRGSKDLAQYDPVVLRHAQVESLLKELANGRATLVELDGTAPVEQQGGSGIGPALNRYEGSAFSFADFGLGPAGRRYRDGW